MSFMRPNIKEMVAIAKRFAKDGETRNAVEILKLMSPEQQLKFSFQPGRNFHWVPKITETSTGE